jgi:glycosyltransferase involved in cell wall biosynthesis
MINNHLHIISFDVPYPADYGGVIDVFYKLKSLSKLGVKIHLHCFEYGRSHAEELEKYCAEVIYYKRNTSLIQHFSATPYIIKSRDSQELVNNLKKDDYPILCEGMHTCSILKYFENRKIIYRSSNVEHVYYFELAKKENSLFKKLFFIVESVKLKLWEKNLAKASLFLTVSKSEQAYYKKQFRNIDIENVFSFYNQNTNLLPDYRTKTKNILFHGNLSVQENIETANYILKKLAPNCTYNFVIAGKNPSKKMLLEAEKLNNVTLLANLTEEEMNLQISQSQINLLLTKQATGLKLKLLNSLYQGKFCLVNDKMLVGTGLNACVEIANSSQEILTKINELMHLDFTESLYAKRASLISKEFDNNVKAEKLIRLVF